MLESVSRLPVRSGSSLGLTFAALLLLAPDRALAQDEGSNDGDAANYQRPPIERRGGFVVGAVPALTLAHFSGSLNEVDKLDDPAFHESATTFGFGVTGWIGVAVRDWFTFGVGHGLSSSLSSNPHGTSQAYLLRLEGFPAYSLGGAYRDLGVSGDFGVGSGVLSRDGDDVADGGDMAHVGIGVFYEPLRLWKLSMGPSLTYSYDFSQALGVSTVSLGFRVVLYTSQPKE